IRELSQVADHTMWIESLQLRPVEVAELAGGNRSEPRPWRQRPKDPIPALPARRPTRNADACIRRGQHCRPAACHGHLGSEPVGAHGLSFLWDPLATNSHLHALDADARGSMGRTGELL